jgi:hypothetical protein
MKIMTHVTLLEKNGFEIVRLHKRGHEGLVSIRHGQLALEFRHLSGEDFSTSGAGVVAKGA